MKQREKVTRKWTIILFVCILTKHAMHDTQPAHQVRTRTLSYLKNVIALLATPLLHAFIDVTSTATRAATSSAR